MPWPQPSCLEVARGRAGRFSGLWYFMPGEPLLWFPVNAREKINSQRSSWSLGPEQLHLNDDFALGNEISFGRGGMVDT